MHITNGLGVYWWSPKSAQIGLDPRIGVELKNLTPKELSFVDSLTVPHTDSDIKELAASKGISPQRTQEILANLDRAGVMDSDRPFTPDGDAWWRLHHRLPQHRKILRICVPNLDALGFGIAIELIRAGIGTLTTADTQTVGEFDYPQVRGEYFGLPRVQALTSIAREINPHITLQTDQPPHLVVMTGSHCVDPLHVGKYLAQGIPVFQAVTEEVDIFVGPVSVPHQSPCGTCVYLERLDADAHWAYFAAQACAGRPVIPEWSSFLLAQSLAVREILNLADGFGCSITHARWLVRPSPAAPMLTALEVHPSCDCVTPQKNDDARSPQDSQPPRDPNRTS
ncbi:hypothetical protein JOD55_001635 [Arcanobacterium pluranimalium]|uniref:hypothetical protein n=1 Tax=Arcanobacterium pluranimalium TaxID=108028 RepID=UPI00195EE5CB|nr:hypothetical protein [Arcanobacterium pluranimalium]MBM7825808.1 hypothetical protein [Arcanobacterium pluranimalium]